jgi:hypothetical protein
MTIWTLATMGEQDGRDQYVKTYLSASTSGKLPLPLSFCMGDCVSTTGVDGPDNSPTPALEAKTSPPRASSSSACFVFFVPNFMPLPLKAGLRAAGDEVLMRETDVGTSGASKR